MNVKILKGLVILILLVLSSFLIFKIAGFSVQSSSRSGIVVDEGIVVIYDEFDGGTTDFLRMDDSELEDVFPLILEKTDCGKIRYLSPIDLTVKVQNRTVNLNENAEEAYNFIFVDTDFFTHMSKPAEISIYKLRFANPRILKNGALCLPPNCNILSYNGTLVFNVTSFSNYSAEATPYTAVSPVQWGGESGVGFSVDRELLNVSLTQGESKIKKVIIKNTGNEPILLTLSIEGLGQFVKIDKNAFSLNPGEEKEVAVEFSADEKTGARFYTGRITISTVSLSKAVNIILEVLEKPLPLKLFVLKSELVSDRLIKKDRLKAKLYIKNIDETRRDIALKYYIKDFYGKDIKIGEENITINKEARLERGFSIPGDLSSGKYVFYTELLYNGEISAASVNTFDLIEAASKGEVSSSILIAVLFILILILILLKRRKKGKNKR